MDTERSKRISINHEASKKQQRERQRDKHGYTQRYGERKCEHITTGELAIHNANTNTDKWEDRTESKVRKKEGKR